MNMRLFSTLTIAAIVLVAVAAGTYDEQTAEATNHTTTTNAVRTVDSIPDADEPASLLVPIPERAGPRIRTSGRVPHFQIDVTPVTEVDKKLRRLAFSLPGVDERPTIVSLPGASGMWLLADVPIVRPQAIVRGREFAHIHPDGSLHAPLPVERALEVAEKGWGERHPWADRRDGWGGFVMLFTPQSMDELTVIFQLIVESYNYVTGQRVEASSFERDGGTMSNVNQ